jgi:hypothetical protein
MVMELGDKARTGTHDNPKPYPYLERIIRMNGS